MHNWSGFHFDGDNFCLAQARFVAFDTIVTHIKYAINVCTLCTHRVCVVFCFCVIES